MKKVRSGLVALGLALAMIFSLAACDDGGIDASGYVKFLLDQWYIGQYDDAWLEELSSSKSEADEIYLDSIQGEVDAFVSYAGIDYPDDVNDRLLDLWKQICAKASYEVGEAGKPDKDGTYTVKVTFKPLDVYKLLDEAYPAFSESFEAEFEDVDTESMSDAEFDDWFENVYDKAYRDGLCDLLESLVPQVGYLPEKSLVVQVENDGEYYGLNDDDNLNLASSIISTYY